jgi:hypothetical protein
MPGNMTGGTGHGSGRMRPRTALALAGICMVAAGCNPNGTKVIPATSRTASPTSITVPAVAEAALDGLLLSVADINAAIGTTDLSVSADSKRMDDLSNLVSRPECLPIFGPAGEKPYANSGSTAVRVENLSDPAHTHTAVQTVVLLSSAPQAAAFFTASSQNWQQCSNGSFAHNMSGGRDVWEVGSVSNANGLLTTSARITEEIYDKPPTQGRGTAQRVLTVRNNVVIDILTDSADANEGAAVKIAQQIAAKVPD